MISLIFLPLIGIGLGLLHLVARTIYNLYFHPLAKFPGPKLAAASELWHCMHWTGGRYPYAVDEVHKKYGDVVRLGPNDISFASLQSSKDIYGHASKNHLPLLKSVWYEMDDAEPDIVSQRDPAQHREIRKSLAHAFSAKALRDQGGVVKKYADLFVSQIEKLGGGSEGIDMNKWFMWVTFDIIGDLAFGDSFNAVKEAKTHFWIDIIVDSVYAGQIGDIFRRLPAMKLLAPFMLPKGLMADRARHLKYTKQRVATRRTSANNRDDFFSHLLSDKATDVSTGFLEAQATTLIVAGSDTTATFLGAVTYYLTTNPLQLARLQEEIRGAFKESSDINDDAAKKLPYLFAVIEEGMRIFPSVPFGLPRVSPGVVVDGHFIPAGTIVSTSIWATNHSPSHFYEPESFHPERWLPKDHAFYSPVFDSDILEASKPFSLGPRACLGINLAYMDMRMILAKVAYHFDWELINKDINWREETRLNHLWKMPKLMVKYTPVKREVNQSVQV